MNIKLRADPVTLYLLVLAAYGAGMFVFTVRKQNTTDVNARQENDVFLVRKQSVEDLETWKGENVIDNVRKQYEKDFKTGQNKDVLNVHRENVEGWKHWQKENVLTSLKGDRENLDPRLKERELSVERQERSWTTRPHKDMSTVNKQDGINLKTRIQREVFTFRTQDREKFNTRMKEEDIDPIEA